MCIYSLKSSLAHYHTLESENSRFHLCQIDRELGHHQLSECLESTSNPRSQLRPACRLIISWHSASAAILRGKFIHYASDCLCSSGSIYAGDCGKVLKPSYDIKLMKFRVRGMTFKSQAHLSIVIRSLNGLWGAQLQSCSQSQPTCCTM